MILEIIILVAALIIFMVFILAGYSVAIYNAFASDSVDIATMFSNLKTEYQRRADLFMNLVETTKSYKKFEKETLITVTAARAGNFGATKEEQVKKLAKLDGIFSKLAFVVENYPNLKSSEQHNKLMDEVTTTENRINIARTDFNEETRQFNERLRVFPSNMIGRIFGFRIMPFYESEPGTEKAKKIDLE